ncbi:MAG TPA: alanine--tRNA ligase [Candidatus Methylacidiphilales bacterium]|jgi:alanyl-tRNA synthetase|nr:alanine--tRNA ligase [Candidatus Methylacidiphilales bacterium]
MTSSAIRQSFLDFFREKGHAIVPSSPLLPDAPNLLFTNAGMNQFVPIFLGQTPAPQPPRAADTQKCIRAGGKHNDLEDVGFDTYHHTFFEMLGNWSFGDYFKKEAIAWAWELVVGRWNFPASRIYATVYQPGPGDPAGFDQEAHDHWAAIFTAAGLDPALHIVNGNKKDNFWMMGDTGPCGPCSELHVDLTSGPRDLPLERQKSGRELVNKGDARCIEIWNLVFIQFNANPDGAFVELPARHVDTGMGFERVTSMIQGTKGFTNFENAKISNYETDVFRPIFDELEKLTGKKYASTLPASAQNETAQEKIDVAFRVIADHIRTLSFSIADGIQPGNEGRGYVLRRILRRAVRYGRNLGLREPFLGKLVAVLGATMGQIFPEVVAKADLIRKTLTQEEESFLRTLERGIELFEGVIAGMKSMSEAKEAAQQRTPPFTQQFKFGEGKFPGNEAFRLYDTYGFPLDLTELMARERGLTVDVAEFNRLMEEQKARSRAAQEKEVIIIEESQTADGFERKHEPFGPLTVKTRICSLGTMNVGYTFNVYNTPFYTEMGGQVGDGGTVEIEGKTFKLQRVRNHGGVVWHDLAEGPNSLSTSTEIVLSVDAPRRSRIESHHSATHLLNWALRKVLGNTVSQKGSYVGPDRLRFDFSHGAAMTPAELAQVETLVNEKINEDVPVTWDERPYAQVKGDPSILQFFGDKYGDTVRVVSIGDFSRELCGGTHVRHSAQVGWFKILHESAIAAGIRRIEAASGDALRVHLEELLDKQAVAGAGPAPVPSSASPLLPSAGLPSLWQLYKDREKLLHDLAAQRAQHEKETMKQQEAAFQKQAAAEAAELIIESPKIGEIPFIVHLVDYQPAAYLPFLADALKQHWEGVALLAAIDEGKVALLCSVSAPWTKKIEAGKLIQAIAPLVGGKGGGRPELAQGGGTNPGGITAALEKAEEMLEAVS